MVEGDDGEYGRFRLPFIRVEARLVSSHYCCWLARGESVLRVMVVIDELRVIHFGVEKHQKGIGDQHRPEAARCISH